MNTKTTPTVTVRRANERFHSDHGWLDSFHTFSFGDHYDPAFMGFRNLRVINDDTVAPKMGFGQHPHRDMEIISYVLSGQLEHKDSMGNGRIIEPGDFQYMSAGSGVLHSEFNPSDTEPVHFLQIWIKPDVLGAEPRYEEKSVGAISSDQPLTLVASSDGRDGSIQIRQKAELYFGNLAGGAAATARTRYDHHWVHMISGRLTVAGEVLEAGDGIAIEGPVGELSAEQAAEFILFSL